MLRFFVIFMVGVREENVRNVRWREESGNFRIAFITGVEQTIGAPVCDKSRIFEQATHWIGHCQSVKSSSKCKPVRLVNHCLMSSHMEAVVRRPTERVVVGPKDSPRCILVGHLAQVAVEAT